MTTVTTHQAIKTYFYYFHYNNFGVYCVYEN